LNKVMKWNEGNHFCKGHA